MNYFYTKELGFLVDTVHKHIPDDAIPLTRDEYVKIIEGHQKGKDIVIKDGKLSLVEQSNENAIRDIINHRNHLLEKTDWSQLPDVPTALAEVYKEYRQKLRDLPEQEGFPDNITWPTPPERK